MLKSMEVIFVPERRFRRTGNVVLEVGLGVEEVRALRGEAPVEAGFPDDGERALICWIDAMAGATERHNIIAMNVAALLWSATDGVTCRVCGSDMLVKVSAAAAYYPDVTVTCDPTDTEPLYKTRPCLIVEVISPSTSLTDVREKLLEYQRIESLKSYLIVYQDARCVIHYHYDVDGAWRQDTIIGDGDIQVSCPQATLSLSQIYRGIAEAAD
jgi:Uma2 family endonuclease